MLNLQEHLDKINKINNTLNEGISDIAYHFTSVTNLMKIIGNNEFLPTTTIGKSRDQVVNKNKYYYMSTTRSKSAGFVKGDVKIVLDGRKLKHNYKVAPVDFWANQADPDKEQEDRIVTDQPVIPNALNYILEIHIHLTNHTSVTPKLVNTLDQISKINNIPTYYYESFNDWLSQNPNKRVDPTKNPNLDQYPIEDPQINPVNEYRTFMRLAALYAYNNQKNTEQIVNLLPTNLYDEFKNTLDDYTNKYLKKDAYYHDQAEFPFIGIFTRSNKSPIGRQITKLIIDDMRKLNVKTIQDYINKKNGG
jgi:hypothetical protein